MIDYKFDSDFPAKSFSGANIVIAGGHDASLDFNQIEKCLSQKNNHVLVCVNAHYKRQNITPNIYFGSFYEDAIPDNKISIACINRNKDYHLNKKWENKCNRLFTFNRERRIKPFEDYRDEWANTFQHIINGNPLSGMIALYFFSTLPVKSIYVCGMDFYHDENSGDIIDYIWPHNVREQSEWARELWRTDMRITYSPHLMGVLKLQGEVKGLPFRNFSGRVFI